MPAEQIVQKYGYVELEPGQTRARDQRLVVQWSREPNEYEDGNVQLKLVRTHVVRKRSTTKPDVWIDWYEGDLDEVEMIGLSRREINNLIDFLKKARRQAFGEDK